MSDLWVTGRRFTPRYIRVQEHKVLYIRWVPSCEADHAAAEGSSRQKYLLRLHLRVISEGFSQAPVPLFASTIRSKTVNPVTHDVIVTATESTTTADFVYADFNITHGLRFAGASGTSSCANITELQYGEVHGDADRLQGSLDVLTREEGEEVVTTEVRTSEPGEHARDTPIQVHARRKGCRCGELVCEATHSSQYRHQTIIENVSNAVEIKAYTHAHLRTANNKC